MSFWCRIGLHDWRGWFRYSAEQRYEYRCCGRKGCLATKYRKLHYKTPINTWHKFPTPHSQKVK